MTHNAVGSGRGGNSSKMMHNAVGFGRGGQVVEAYPDQIQRRVVRELHNFLILD